MITEASLARVLVDLGAPDAGGPTSAAEQRIIEHAQTLPRTSKGQLDDVAESLRLGLDPLGEAFLNLRSGDVRRADGAVYTPPALIAPMSDWVTDQQPARIVDPGAGSGRFMFDLLRRIPEASGVAIELDPLACLMTRAGASVLDLTNLRVIQKDFTRVQLGPEAGVTAFVGNPPYVRHHGIAPQAKARAKLAAASLGLQISGLAGLHAHFFLYTALLARANDIGCFVTSSEWLDVNYGQVVRTLLLKHLGAESLHVLEPSALPFSGTQTTAVVSTFRVGVAPESVRIDDVSELSALGPLAKQGRPVSRDRLVDSYRWSSLLHTSTEVSDGFVELGEICRVHRGAVTGANATFIQANSDKLPNAVLFSSITRARELFDAGPTLKTRAHLKFVVDIPAELDELSADDQRAVRRFISAARSAGVDKGYIAKHRRAWWSVGLKQPAPILASYMARQVPAFVVNEAEARHINVAHGLYPREQMTRDALDNLASALRVGTDLRSGRVYAGGLTKFEPREMERLLVPAMAVRLHHGPTTTLDPGGADQGGGTRANPLQGEAAR